MRKVLIAVAMFAVSVSAGINAGSFAPVDYNYRAVEPRRLSSYPMPQRQIECDKCSYCEGFGTRVCLYCEGSGRIDGNACTVCKGRGVTLCKRCDGRGQICR
jgi:hypothetical protein